jgi:hypothetical protein
VQQKLSTMDWNAVIKLHTTCFGGMSLSTGLKSSCGQLVFGSQFMKLSPCFSHPCRLESPCRLA